MRDQQGQVGVVIAGAGARGAYEAGVLSVVMPALARVGGHPPLLVGTSAGAINAALFAAHAHLPAERAAEQVLSVWRRIDWRDVFRPPLRSAPTTALRYAAEVIGLPRPSLTSLLDTAPLQRTADVLVDWPRLHANVADGLLDAVAVVATDTRGHSVVFVERPGTRPLPDSDPDRAIDYVGTDVDAEHVLASAAIPIAFPAQRVTRPSERTGWYTDGGDRLNAPLKPALALGADRLVVVATHPATYATTPAAASGDPRPEVDDLAVQVLEAVLVDRMVEDVRALGRVNELVAGHPSTDRRIVPYSFVGPPTRSALGELAEEVYDERFGGLGGRTRGIGSPFPWLRRLLASTDGPRSGDLLSFLFFDPGFIDRAIELGRAHAEQAVSGGQIDWATMVPTTTPVASGRSAE